MEAIVVPSRPLTLAMYTGNIYWLPKITIAQTNTNIVQIRKFLLAKILRSTIGFSVESSLRIKRRKLIKHTMDKIQMRFDSNQYSLLPSSRTAKPVPKKVLLTRFPGSQFYSINILSDQSWLI